jgi:hypothetical protein
MHSDPAGVRGVGIHVRTSAEERAQFAYAPWLSLIACNLRGNRDLSNKYNVHKTFANRARRVEIPNTAP